MIRLFCMWLLGLIMTTNMQQAFAEKSNEKPLVVILLGAPGSGKGTQAVELSKSCNLPHISTGDLFRENIKNQTEIGKQVKSFLDKGQLVPDSVVFDVLYDRISKPDCQKGYILDGFPRTSAQAHELEDSLSKKVRFVVFNLKVADEAVVERLSGRLICKNCGKPYHKVANPPKQEGVCDACQGELYQRTDDNAEVIKERLKVYHAQTKPLEEFFQEKGQLLTIDASRAPSVVQADIEAQIKSLQK